MQKRNWSFGFILIILPLVLSGWISVFPIAREFLSARQELQRAISGADSETELAALENLLTYTPWRGDLWERVGRLRMNTSDAARAVDAFESAQKQGQLSEQGKVWWADALLSFGEVGKSSAVLESIVTSDSTLLRQVIALQVQMRDFTAAVLNIEKVLAITPDDLELTYRLGIIKAASAPDEALPYLQKAVQSETRGQSAQVVVTVIDQFGEKIGYEERLFQVGQALAGVEEWDAASVAFQNAVDQDPMNPVYWALLGEAQQQTGLDGYASLQKAWQLSPENEIVNGLLGIYYRRKGKLDLAEHYLAEAVSLNPDSINWEIEMGNLLADKGDLDNASIHFQAAIKKDEQNWVSWRELAVFCVKHNYRVQEIAIPSVRKAMVLKPSSPALMDLMGTAYMMVNDLASAERFFLQAEQLDPGQAAILIHLGQLYLYKNDKHKAFEFFRQAAQTARDDRLRDLANRLLIENGGNP